MKYVFACFSCLVVVALIAPTCFAETLDYTDPANNPTSQTWFIPPELFPLPDDAELPHGSGPNEVAVDLYPILVENPYGQPIAHAGPGWEFEWTEGWGENPDGNPPILTLHFAGMDETDDLEISTIAIDIPNNPENNPYKEITWSIISDKAPRLGTDGHLVSVDPAGPDPYTISYPMPQPGPIQLGGGSSDGGVWYEYSGVIRIEPNPEFETLVFQFYECTNIAELTIKTVCVPEPGILALLVSAGIGLVMVRRRRS